MRLVSVECTAAQQFRQWVWHTFVAGLAVCFLTLLLIIAALVQYAAKDNKALKKAMSATIGVVVTATTGATTSIVQKLTAKEKVHTVSEMQAVFVQRSVFLSFCLGPVMTIAIPFITGQLRNGDFDDLITNLMSILLLDILNQCFQSLVVETIDEHFKKKRGYKGFCGARTCGELGGCGLPVPDIIADVPLPGPAMAETRAELVAALKPPKFDLTTEYLAALRVIIYALTFSSICPWALVVGGIGLGLSYVRLAVLLAVR
jgi:hypothetical protein